MGWAGGLDLKMEGGGDNPLQSNFWCHKRCLAKLGIWKWLSVKLLAGVATKIFEEHLWITSFFVKLFISSLKLKRKLTSSQVLFKDFDERFLEHHWQLLRKYLSLCKGENLHPEKSQSPWKGFKSLSICLAKSSI